MHSLNNSMVGFLFLLLTFFSFRGHAADPSYFYHICPNTTTFAKNSTYQENLKTLLDSFSRSTFGFYTGYDKDKAGQDPDDVHGVFLCRGDLSTSTCEECVTFAIGDVRQRCPVEKVAVIWYNECLLRYSNVSIISLMDVTPGFQMLNTQNSLDPARFNNEVGILMNQTTVTALDSPRKFATRINNIPGFQTLYGLVQCTPDISRTDCNTCLREAIAILPNCCSGKLGGQVLYPSYIVRYEVYPFFNQPLTAAPSPLLPPPPLSRPKGTTRGIPSKFVVPIVLSSITSVSLVIYAFFLLWRKKQKRRMKDQQKIKDLDGIDATELQFEFRTIRDATNNFSVENKLGRGGFGTVYKGKLPDGENIAVKRLSSNSGQGEQEFKNEVLLVAKLQHKNLARLLGFCLEGSERLLIYEFMPNSSLDTFIFVPIKRSTLSWEIRYKIIRGIARGLLYLHEDSRLRIVHRDLKASNILLDANMDAKISDFGLARLFDMDQTQGDTKRIVGTFGYMAPEYLRRGHYSSKSDVFSFGVLILEIISGQKTGNFHNGGEEADLLAYAWENWREGTSLNLVDPTLVGSRSEMMQCIHIGLLCVQESIASRPTMASVVHMLTSVTASLPMPSKPAFLVAIRSDLSAANKQSGIHSVNKVSITALDPR